MGTAFLLEMLWKSAAIAVAVLVLLRLLRSQHPAERAAVLRISGLVLLALPLVSLLSPAIRIAVLPAEPVVAVPVDAPSLPRPSTSSGRTDFSEAVTAQQTTPWDDPAPLFLILYAGGVCLVGLRLAVGLWTLRGWTEGASPVEQPEWVAAFDRIRRAAGAQENVRLLETTECGSPLSWGWRRPVILVDRDRLDRSEDADGILAHEIAHIVRRDWPALMAMHVATALFWFNPLVWLLEREAVQQAEEAADAQALAGTEPARYAQMLLSYAEYACAGVPANCMAPAGGLKRRVKAILAHSGATRGRRWARLAILGCVAVAGPISAAKLVAATGEPAKPAIASEEWAASAGVPAAPAAPKAQSAPKAPKAPRAPLPLEDSARQIAPVPTVAEVAQVAQVAQVAPIAHVAAVATVAPVSRVLAVSSVNGVVSGTRVTVRGNTVTRETLSPREIAEAQREAQADAAEATREAVREAEEARREAIRETEQAKRDAEQATRDGEQAGREAEQARREAAEETRQAVREAQQAAREAQQEGREAARNLGDSLRGIIADSQAAGMRGGAEGMEAGGVQLRAEARKLRDPSYRSRQIAEARARGDTVTDADLLRAIPRMESGADRMRDGAKRMREGSVRLVNGSQRMREGADRMDRGAERMRQAALDMRRPEYRRQKIAESAARGETVTDRQLLDSIPGLEAGAREMNRGAKEMRRSADEMAAQRG